MAGDDAKVTIDVLSVLFEASPQRDEERFAELFDRHVARHEARRATDDAAACQAAQERSVAKGRGAW